jgi:hypothetical protein
MTSPISARAKSRRYTSRVAWRVEAGLHLSLRSTWSTSSRPRAFSSARNVSSVLRSSRKVCSSIEQGTFRGLTQHQTLWLLGWHAYAASTMLVWLAGSHAVATAPFMLADSSMLAFSFHRIPSTNNHYTIISYHVCSRYLTSNGSLLSSTRIMFEMSSASSGSTISCPFRPSSSSNHDEGSSASSSSSSSSSSSRSESVGL